MLTLDQILKIMEQNKAWVWSLEIKPAGGKAVPIGAYEADEPDAATSEATLRQVMSELPGQVLRITAKRAVKSHGAGIVGPFDFTAPGPVSGLAGLSGGMPHPSSPFELFVQQMGGLGGFIPRGVADQERALATRELQVAIKEAMLERDRKEWEEKKKELLEDIKERERRAESRSEQVARGVGKVVGDIYDDWAGSGRDRQIAGAQGQEQEMTPAEAAIEELATHIHERLKDLADVGVVARVAVALTAALPVLKEKDRLGSTEASITKLLTALQG